jgi:hypothetical protein
MSSAHLQRPRTHSFQYQATPSTTVDITKKQWSFEYTRSTCMREFGLELCASLITSKGSKFQVLSILMTQSCVHSNAILEYIPSHHTCTTDRTRVP